MSPDQISLADQVVDAAARSFAAEHPGLELGPVLVVIPAFNEADAIGGVLDGIPRRAPAACTSTRWWSTTARGAPPRSSPPSRAHCASLARNCGQGSAFKASYRIGREHGARYLVTLDADGEWDPADVPTVLEPVVAGAADLVLGSRVLGNAETEDAFRRAGVGVFAAVVRRLTGVAVTDTSSGLRAMRAELTATVRLEQPQYQSSELLLGAIYQGYRVTERPTVQHKRAAGQTKKGHNLTYGLRYGRVVVRTWWRERRAARVATLPQRERPRAGAGDPRG